MSTVLDDLGSFLQASGVGLLGTTLFKGRIPLDAPGISAQDSLLALIEVPGLPSERVHESRDASIEQPMIQVVSRGLPHDYVDARTRAQAAYEALDGLTNLYLGSTFYLWIFAQQPPFVLRQADEMGRPLIVFSVRCGKALSPALVPPPLGTSFVYPFVAQTTVVVPGFLHGLGTPHLVWALYDTQIPAHLIQPSRFTVDPVTGDVRVTFPTAQSGRLILSAAAVPGFSMPFTATDVVTILGSEHNLGTADLIPALYDANVPAAFIEGETLTVDPATFDVVVTFAVPQSGRVVLYGAT